MLYISQLLRSENPTPPGLVTSQVMGYDREIFVDPSTKFMDGRETYLQFNVKLSLPSGATPTRLQLDKCTSVSRRSHRKLMKRELMDFHDQTAEFSY